MLDLLRPLHRVVDLIFGHALGLEGFTHQTELPTTFVHHGVGRTTHSIHGHGTEHEGQHHPDEDTAQDGWVQQSDVVVVNHILDAHGSTGRVLTEDTRLNRILLHSDDVRRQKCEGSQSRRADGEALTGGRRGVPERIEHVGAVADKAGLAGHFGVATGVVSNGTIRVSGQSDAQRGEHAHRGDTNPIKTEQEVVTTTREIEGKHDANHDDGDGDPRGDHANRDARDDHGGRTSLGLLGNALRGLVLVTGVVLREPSDHESTQKAGHDGPPNAAR